jgi:hypothetical protein
MQFIFEAMHIGAGREVGKPFLAPRKRVDEVIEKEIRCLVLPAL